MTQQEQGRFTIPTRVYLSAENRARLEQLIYSEGYDLSDLLSELLADYLSARPLPTSPSPASGATLAELRRRRAEAHRLRAARANGPLPDWFDGYLAQIEADLARLEHESHGG